MRFQDFVLKAFRIQGLSFVDVCLIWDFVFRLRTRVSDSRVRDQGFGFRI